MRYSLKALLSILATSSLLGVSFGSAQALLNSYDEASAALRASVAAFPTDQVESLDTLRTAETAFGPLGAVLEPALRRGLEKTFSRAEEAIVNQSETDLQVQAAVLQGGFGRAVYQGALESAANGDVENAQTFFAVLARDLGFSDTEFSGSSQAALQSAFERRLAVRGLAQLDGFGGDLGSRYGTLAQLYSYVFLVQDSPRLPPQTRDTVIGTIRSLVAERPTDEGVTLLRAQLEGFSRNAERAERSAGAAAQNPVQGSESQAGARDSRPQNSGAQAGTSETTATAAGGTDTLSETTPFVPDVTPDGSTGPATGTDADTASTDTAGTDIVGTDTTGTAKTNTPAAPDNTAQAGTAASATITALPFLTQEVRTILFAATGLFALLALIRLLFASSRSPWQDAAVALLLLPIVTEGLIALATFLAPLTGQPLLAQAETYSLFTNPLTQLAWLLLSASAILCLALSWRASAATNDYAEDVTETEPDVTVVQRERQTSPQPTRSTPLTTGTLNWDEDF